MLLEYDVARMIHALSDPEPTVVGVMGSLPVMGDMHAQAQGGVLVPWAIARHLKTGFDTIHLPESIDDLPASVDVMMVVHPRAMSDRAIYELEQFLFRGGRALLFVDPKANRRVGRAGVGLDVHRRPRPVARDVGHRGSGPPARRRPVDGAHDQRGHRGPPGPRRVSRVARRVGRALGAGRSGDRAATGPQPRERRLHPAGRKLATGPRAVDHLQPRFRPDRRRRGARPEARRPRPAGSLPARRRCPRPRRPVDGRGRHRVPGRPAAPDGREGRRRSPRRIRTRRSS